MCTVENQSSRWVSHVPYQPKRQEARRLGCWQESDMIYETLTIIPVPCPSERPNSPCKTMTRCKRDQLRDLKVVQGETTVIVNNSTNNNVWNGKMVISMRLCDTVPSLLHSWRQVRTYCHSQSWGHGDDHGQRCLIFSREPGMDLLGTRTERRILHVQGTCFTPVYRSNPAKDR